MKVDPMKPAPPVTSSFIPLSAGDVPDLGPREVPGQPPLVAGGRLRREAEVREVDDVPGPRREVPRAVGHAGRDPEQPRLEIGRASCRERGGTWVGGGGIT